MRNRALTALLLAGCLAGGVLAAVVAAAPGAVGALLSSTATTATEPVVTTVTTTTTSTATTTAPQRIPAGVTVGGVAVGGMTPADAYAAVREQFERPLLLLVGRRRFSVTPEKLGTVAYALKAINRAETAAPGTAVPLDVVVSRRKVVAPRVTRKSFGPVVVIRRGSNRLYLYRGMRYWRLFPVATGQNTYPTPLGRFQIVVKWRNPWWYPPSSPWAAGQKPIPPGPDNPLGTRWMGLSAPGVGIHGTPNDSSIGYSVSHGCIRMHIPDAEWLFVRVRIGTPVYIVAA